MEKHTNSLLTINQEHNIVQGGPAREVQGRMVQGQLFMACAQDWMEEGELQANIRRLVACWNACHGLATKELEQNGLVSAVGHRLLELEQERDALVAQNAEFKTALLRFAEIVDALDHHTHPNIECDAVAADMRRVANDSANASLARADADVVASLSFPTMLRKMWAGHEVQAWLNEQANRRRQQDEAGHKEGVCHSK